MNQRAVKSERRTTGVVDEETLQSALERQKVRLVNGDDAIRLYWGGAPNSCEIVVPGPTGKWGNVFKIKNSLKAEGFSFNRDKKLWYRSSVPAERPDGIAAFNLGGVKLRGVG